MGRGGVRVPLRECEAGRGGGVGDGAQDACHDQPIFEVQGDAQRVLVVLAVEDATSYLSLPERRRGAFASRGWLFSGSVPVLSVAPSARRSCVLPAAPSPCNNPATSRCISGTEPPDPCARRRISYVPFALAKILRAMHKHGQAFDLAQGGRRHAGSMSSRSDIVRFQPMVKSWMRSLRAS